MKRLHTIVMDCHINNIDKAIQEYKDISGLSEIQLINWIKINPYVYIWIENRAKELSK